MEIEQLREDASQIEEIERNEQKKKREEEIRQFFANYQREQNTSHLSGVEEGQGDFDFYGNQDDGKKKKRRKQSKSRMKASGGDIEVVADLRTDNFHESVVNAPKYYLPGIRPQAELKPIQVKALE